MYVYIRHLEREGRETESEKGHMCIMKVSAFHLLGNATNFM